MKKKMLAAALMCVMIGVLLAGCAGDETSQPDAAQSKGRVILATTTSTQDSGLLEFILPVFTAETGWEIYAIAVGTGEALQMGRDGEADVLLVHSRSEEDRFVADGYAEARFDVMYNDFIIVGPKDGPIAHNHDIEMTFRRIAELELTFISRGDNSGTHMKETEIWQALGTDPLNNSNYMSVGQGMGATLGMAIELNAYTLTDRATWLNYADRGDLIIICEGAEILFNPYGVIPIYANVNARINTEGGQAFVDWITSQSTQYLIALFGVEEFGAPLFFPNAR